MVVAAFSCDDIECMPLPRACRLVFVARLEQPDDKGRGLQVDIFAITRTEEFSSQYAQLVYSNKVDVSAIWNGDFIADAGWIYLDRREPSLVVGTDTGSLGIVRFSFNADTLSFDQSPFENLSFKVEGLDSIHTGLDFLLIQGLLCAPFILDENLNKTELPWLGLIKACTVSQSGILLLGFDDGQILACEKKTGKSLSRDPGLSCEGVVSIFPMKSGSLICAVYANAEVKVNKLQNMEGEVELKEVFVGEILKETRIKECNFSQALSCLFIETMNGASFRIFLIWKSLLRFLSLRVEHEDLAGFQWTVCAAESFHASIVWEKGQTEVAVEILEEREIGDDDSVSHALRSLQRLSEMEREMMECSTRLDAELGALSRLSKLLHGIDIGCEFVLHRIPEETHPFDDVNAEWNVEIVLWGHGSTEDWTIHVEVRTVMFLGADERKRVDFDQPFEAQTQSNWLQRFQIAVKPVLLGHLEINVSIVCPFEDRFVRRHLATGIVDVLSLASLEPQRSQAFAVESLIFKRHESTPTKLTIPLIKRDNMEEGEIRRFIGTEEISMKFIKALHGHGEEETPPTTVSVRARSAVLAILSRIALLRRRHSHKSQGFRQHPIEQAGQELPFEKGNAEESCSLVHASDVVEKLKDLQVKLKQTATSEKELWDYFFQARRF